MHYKNGRLAKVGDPVIGTTYNRKGVQVGILVGITPGSETCNCRVALVEASPIPGSNWGKAGLLHMETKTGGAAPEYDYSLLCPAIDYSACGDLLHADEVLQFIADTAFAKDTPDMLARCINFKKWNPPISERS